jgi:hypothetical protein
MKLKPSDFDWEKYDYAWTYVRENDTVVLWGDRSKGDNGWGFRGDMPSSWWITRTPKPEPVYQLLTPGTWIREGDEMSLGDDCWKKAVGTCGFYAARNEIWRRKLPEGTKLP